MPGCCQVEYPPFLSGVDFENSKDFEDYGKTLKITGRSSSMTNAFVQAILPTRRWSEAEEAEALGILGMVRPHLVCSYCGDPTSEWDHLFPLVRNKQPTGFLHEIRNLVPSCGRCNHSRSGRDWDAWFQSGNGNSPTKRGVPDREPRLARIQRFVAWGKLQPIPFEELAPAHEIESYWQMLRRLQADMVEAQKLADNLKMQILANLDAKHASERQARRSIQ